MSNSLHISLVEMHVKADQVDAFREACLANARDSRGEPGVKRFDLLHQADDPTRFVFVEVFRDPAAAAAHRETPHYQRWRDTVAAMMATPRMARKFVNASPDDSGW
jgi:(4S)-4-hydroxy-5-phosphonooxypentane-2,3-dione isomerase